MSLQRRLLIYLLASAPLVWAIVLVASADRARLEVNELFDTEIIRLARQVQTVFADASVDGARSDMPKSGASGEADLADLAIAVWDEQGRLIVVDREGAQLPRRGDATGFVDLQIDGDPWRVYYLQSTRGDRLVAAGQRVHERDELVWNLVTSQLLPWILMLPLLLAAMAWAVRRALRPLRELTDELSVRGAADLQPLALADAPGELRPLVRAMNGLFERTAGMLERERRFTADAAHELRTPLAVLRAQWDVLRRSSAGTERERAQAKLATGLDRMDRLVTQLLMLSRLDATERLPKSAPLAWAAIVEQAMSDVLPLAQQRRIDLACDHPPSGQPPVALEGDADLMAVLLRNLIDNAVRYAPQGTTVTLHLDPDGLRVENDGPAMPEQILAQLGERFHRIEGQGASGSGLGVSIVQRIAALHGMQLCYRSRSDGAGVIAELRRVNAT